MRYLIVVTVFLLLLGARPAGADDRSPEASLIITEPQATYVRTTVNQGVRTLQYVNRESLLTTTQWPLAFKIKSLAAVAFVAKRDADEEREAMTSSCLKHAEDIFEMRGITVPEAHHHKLVHFQTLSDEI